MKKAIIPVKHPSYEREDFLGKNPMRKKNNNAEEPCPKRKREKDMGDNL